MNDIIKASREFPGVMWVPARFIRNAKAKALAKSKARASRLAQDATARMRHASRRADDRPPPPPSVARRLREASGNKVETIEERMAAEAARVHRERRVTELASGVPAPPDMHRYAVARRRGLTHADAIAEARS